MYLHSGDCFGSDKNSAKGYVAPGKDNVFFICAHRLMILYMCTKICKNISKGFRIIELTQFAK